VCSDTKKHIIIKSIHLSRLSRRLGTQTFRLNSHEIRLGIMFRKLDIKCRIIVLRRRSSRKTYEIRTEFNGFTSFKQLMKQDIYYFINYLQTNRIPMHLVSVRIYYTDVYVTSFRFGNLLLLTNRL